jgi:hypothetical protein
MSRIVPRKLRSPGGKTRPHFSQLARQVGMRSLVKWRRAGRPSGQPTGRSAPQIETACEKCEPDYNPIPSRESRAPAPGGMTGQLRSVSNHVACATTGMRNSASRRVDSGLVEATGLVRVAAVACDISSRYLPDRMGD